VAFVHGVAIAVTNELRRKVGEFRRDRSGILARNYINRHFPTLSDGCGAQGKNTSKLLNKPRSATEQH